MQRLIKKALPHLCIIISVMFIAMLITDLVNRAIQIFEGPYFRILLLIFCIASISTSLILIIQNWNKD